MRTAMVEEQIAARGITDKKIIKRLNQTVSRKLKVFGLPHRIWTFLIVIKFIIIKTIGIKKKKMTDRSFCFVVRSWIFEIRDVSGT
jgi:hypothetical protein